MMNNPQRLFTMIRLDQLVKAFTPQGPYQSFAPYERSGGSGGYGGTPNLGAPYSPLPSAWDQGGGGIGTGGFGGEGYGLGDDAVSLGMVDPSTGYYAEALAASIAGFVPDGKGGFVPSSSIFGRGINPTGLPSPKAIYNNINAPMSVHTQMTPQQAFQITHTPEAYGEDFGNPADSGFIGSGWGMMGDMGSPADSGVIGSGYGMMGDMGGYGMF